MKKYFKTLFFLIVTLGSLAFEARADEWQCDVRGGSSRGLTNSVDAYSRNSNRQCKFYIRLMDPTSIELDHALIFDQAPPAGQIGGTVLRRCAPPNSDFYEAGCPSSLNNTKPTLDFSGYEEDDGECPIKITRGAKIKFLNLRIIARNPNKVFCQPDGTALTRASLTLASLDLASGYAYVSANVNIVQARTPTGATEDPEDTPVVAGQEGPDDPDPDHDGILNDGHDKCPERANSGDGANDDPDRDNRGNGCDRDDDGDLINDDDDNCPHVSNPLQEDADDNGQGDACDFSHGIAFADKDDDGVPDGADNCPYVSNPVQENHDPDGRGDACDTDDDNDGICDRAQEDGTAFRNCELSPTENKEDNCPIDANPDQADLDGNHIGDACEEPILPLDSDGDKLFDSQEAIFGTDPLDPDSDNDGNPDLTDHCAKQPDGSFIDCLQDKTPDTPTPGGEVTPPEPDTTDTDGDLILDSVEENELHSDPGNPDTDGDGICDGPGTGNATQQVTCIAGVNGAGDNCPLVPNPEQEADADKPEVGLACVDDADGDKILDVDDNCPFISNKDQHDDDNDGIGNVCDSFGQDFSQSDGSNSASGCSCDMRSRGTHSADIGMLGLFFLPLLLLQAVRRMKA